MSTGTRITTVVTSTSDDGGERRAVAERHAASRFCTGASSSATQAATENTRMNGWKTQNASSRIERERRRAAA